MKSVFATVVALATVLAVPAFASNLRQDVDRYRATHEKAIVGRLDRLTRLKSVAADPAGIRSAADYLKGQLDARGFKADLFTAPGGSPPVVYGSYASPGATRTVIFYAHYDGQPVTPSKWSSNPFKPVMRKGPLGSAKVDWENAATPFDPEWRLFGRAVADDKASEVTFLTAFDALRATGRQPSVNLKVIWEGEEEAGSPHLAAILKAHAAKLHADLLIIGDGPVHQTGRQMLFFGARGAMDMEATIYGPLHPVHDGHYGNWVPNPSVMAAELIAEMRDDNGNILIPGFLDDVRPLTAAEKVAIAKMPPVEKRLKAEFEIGRTEGKDDLVTSLMRPALNVRGIRAGEVGAHAKNAIPTKAEISVDFRLVPDQTPEGVRRKVEAFLRAKGWTPVRRTPDAKTRRAHPRLIKLVWGSGYPSYRSDMSSPVARAMIAATEAATGGPIAVLPMAGGSVPMYQFHGLLKAPVIGLPVVNHDDNQHAPNENLRLKNLWNGIDIYAAIMGSLRW